MDRYSSFESQSYLPIFLETFNFILFSWVKLTDIKKTENWPRFGKILDLKIKNKIAQGEINVFSHFNIRGYVPFSRFCHLYRK